MTIWAFKGSNDKENDEFISESVRNGISRFGWSYGDFADLNFIKTKTWDSMSDHEKDVWSNSNFLLEIEKGDWIVHINIPDKGMCLAGQVSEVYKFETENNKRGDFRHLISLDKSTIIEFDRNDENVLPIINSRLKLMGRYWRINNVTEFLETIENLKLNRVSGKKKDETPGIFHLKQELNPMYKDLTAKIQKNHPAGKLEALIADVFRKIPSVINVNENGKHKGWGSDYGADLIVTFKSGLPIDGLEKQEILVVQVKSYIGEHWETNAVTQIKEAIEVYHASAGMLLTTAEKTERLVQQIDQLSTDLEKPIALVAGEDVAKFVMRNGVDILL